MINNTTQQWITIYQPEAIISIRIDQILCLSRATDSKLTEITLMTGHKIYTSFGLVELMAELVKITKGVQQWPSSL